MVRALRPVNISPDWLKTVYNAKNGAPTKAEEHFLHPFVWKRREMAKPVPTKTATVHCHPLGDTHPPPPVSLFLLAQNLSSKQITPTDNMQSKLNDEYTCHQLRGKCFSLLPFPSLFLLFLSFFLSFPLSSLPSSLLSFLPFLPPYFPLHHLWCEYPWSLFPKTLECSHYVYTPLDLHLP